MTDTIDRLPCNDVACSLSGHHRCRGADDRVPHTTTEGER